MGKKYGLLTFLLAGLLLASACQGATGTQGPVGPEGIAGDRQHHLFQKEQQDRKG